jgi:excisionase family DNA binding protein
VSDFMTFLGEAVSSTAGERFLDGLADRLASRLEQLSADDGWLDSHEAAAYLGIGLPALHRLTSERRIEFSQLVPGGKCFFKRSTLEEYRAQGLQPPLRLPEDAR